MSEIFWKRKDLQMESARELLKEYADAVDVFDITPPEGVEMLAFGIKGIGPRLCPSAIEAAVDATCEESDIDIPKLIIFLDDTNSSHLELYTVLVENDNSGFPVSYCFLSTAASTCPDKRKQSLHLWFSELRDQYKLNPKFMHVDKDMAEIGAILFTWVLIKIQLCWWHLREAIKRRLKKKALGTTPYDPHQVRKEFPWIDVSFVPRGKADPQDIEGGIVTLPDEEQPAPTYTTPLIRGANTLVVRIPRVRGEAPEDAEGSDDVSETYPCKVLLVDIPAGVTHYSLIPGDPDHAILNALPLSVVKEHRPKVAKVARRRAKHGIFCPKDLRPPIIEMIEQHLCAHPLIPGYCHPSRAGIHEWATKQMYGYCVENDLPEVWAYMYGNWYRCGRWALWARSQCSDIPVLKTTMMVEAQ